MSAGRWRSPLATVLGWLVSLYRSTAMFRSPRCRFSPSCSAYALESLRLHGALRGGWLAVRRVLRCHPWNPGGVDYPPRPGELGGSRTRSGEGTRSGPSGCDEACVSSRRSSEPRK